MNTGKSVCCNAPYKKLAVRQYKCTKCGVVSSQLGKRATLVPSETHRKYKEATNGDYIRNANVFAALIKDMKFPLYIGIYYIRKTQSRFDFDNATSTVMDLIVSNSWIEDDNCDYVLPIPLGYHVDKNSAGFIITATDVKPDYKFI